MSSPRKKFLNDECVLIEKMPFVCVCLCVCLFGGIVVQAIVEVSAFRKHFAVCWLAVRPANLSVDLLAYLPACTQYIYLGERERAQAGEKQQPCPKTILPIITHQYARRQQ